MSNPKELISFREVASFRNGLNFSKESHGNGVPLIGVTDFQNHFTPVYETLSEINPEGITKSDDYIKQNDILFVRSNGNKSLVGRSLFIDKEFDALFSGFCIRARLHSDKILPKFCAYFTRSSTFKTYISSADGTNINNLNQGILSDVMLPLLPLAEQSQIAKVLSDLDAKIELNNKINAELEAMAKLIYDYWFVQFDFPDENGKPYKSSGGKMTYNEELKREIPEEWKVKDLSHIANITMGQSPSGSSYNEIKEGTIFFQGSTDFGWRFPTIRQYTTEPSRMAKVGDILLSVRAPVGTLNIASDDCCIGRGLAALNSKDNATSYLFYVMVYFKQIFDRRNSVGTTFGSITKDDLYSLKLIYPSENILNEYDKKIAVFNNKIFNNHKQNQKLAELRDWLLPMLMNGQVKVK
jgi:type I restriction enzyme, S subunit